jgi:hypothetical protein
MLISNKNLIALNIICFDDQNIDNRDIALQKDLLKWIWQDLNTRALSLFRLITCIQDPSCLWRQRCFHYGHCYKLF